MRKKIQYFFDELLREIKIFWELALFIIAIGIISYGGVIVVVYMQTKVWVVGTSDMISTAIAVVVAVMLFLGFLVALIITSIKTFRKDFNREQTLSHKIYPEIDIPCIDIHINSKDIRYMDANQISRFFKGVKQSLTEYRKSIKEVQKYKQRGTKRGNAWDKDEGMSGNIKK